MPFILYTTNNTDTINNNDDTNINVYYYHYYHHYRGFVSCDRHMSSHRARSMSMPPMT